MFCRNETRQTQTGSRTRIKECCSPLVVLTSGARVAVVTVVFSTHFLSPCHYVLIQQSPTPSIFCCCSPFCPLPPPNLYRSLLTQSSHRILVLHRFLVLPLSKHNDPTAILISHSLHMTGPFNLLTTFFLQFSFTPPLRMSKHSK